MDLGDENAKRQYLEKLKHKINILNSGGANNREANPRGASKAGDRTEQKKALCSASELTPIARSGSEGERGEGEEESSSEEDAADREQRHNDPAYWALPENVRNAIDYARQKSKHSDFYNLLKSLNDKIGVYKKIFYTKTPKYERMFYDRKRRRLEALMRKEQQELEDFMVGEA